MTIDYVPFDTLYISDIFHKLNYESSKILEMIDYRFCTYIFKNGKNKGKICGKKIRNLIIDNCCSQHMNKSINYMANENLKEKKEKKYYIKKENKNVCCWFNKYNKPCGRLVKEKNDYCNFHKNNIIKIKDLYFLIIIYIIIIFIIIIYLYINLNLNTKRKKINKIIDINNIKKIKCEQILKYINIDYKKESHNQYRIKNNKQNIVIRNNSFYDNYNSLKGKGKGCIDFYMYIKNTSYLETIKKLNILYLSFSLSPENVNSIKINTNNRPKEINNKEISFITKNNKLPIINTNYINNIINYLNKERKISLKLIKYLINKNYLNSDNYNNCVFYNESKTYAFLRSTNSKFKKHSGNPDFIIYKNNSEFLYLFESIIDMISYIDLHNGEIKGIFACTGGNMMINKIESLINNNIKEINYCFDNDQQGKYITNFIMNKLKKYNIKHIEIYPKCKDWNEELKNSRNKT